MNNVTTNHKETEQKNSSKGELSNLFNMRKFYITYQKQQTVSVKFNWSHYDGLLNEVEKVIGGEK